MRLTRSDLAARPSVYGHGTPAAPPWCSTSPKMVSWGGCDVRGLPIPAYSHPPCLPSLIYKVTMTSDSATVRPFLPMLH